MKQWGRVKIKYELKQKQVGEYSIKKALKQIDESTYKQTLHNLYEEKWDSLKNEKNRFTKQAKTRDYLLQKGYESEMIMALLND